MLSEGVCSRECSRGEKAELGRDARLRARPAGRTCWPVPRRPPPLPPGGGLRAGRTAAPPERQTLDVGCGPVSVRSHRESMGHTCQAGPGVTHPHRQVDWPQCPFCMDRSPAGVDWGIGASAQ